MPQKSLRIFSLNIEFGKYSNILIPYIQKISKDIDVFCLQEVPRDAKNTLCFEEEYNPHFYEKLVEILPDFTSYYTEFVEDSFGIVTLVRSELKQELRGERYIFGDSKKQFLDK
jgi:hypothetical protein